MANRIPWDKYEVVILIDASIKVINKEITKQDAVKKVSLMLRTKAATSGIIIDNIFRNENGISMQMNIIMALIQNKSSGLHNASKLFCEMVNIYKSNPTLYLQVLTEAKGMIRTLSSSNDDKLNNAYSDNEKTIDIGNAEEGLHSNSTYTREETSSNSSMIFSNLSFADWITQYAGLSSATARAYKSALNTCDHYAFESQLYSESITICTTYNDFIIKYNALMNDEGFIKLSEMKHNYLVAALKKYHEYFYALDTDSALSLSPQNAVRLTAQPSVSDEVQNNCAAILSQDFEDGYQIGDYMYQMRFLSCYEDTFGSELDVTEDELDKLLKYVGQIRDGRLFCKCNNDTPLITSIFDVVENAFENGATAVFFECIYERYTDKLNSEMNIYNADALRDIMKNDSRFQVNYHIERSAIVKNGISADTTNEIKVILQSSHTPLTFEDFKERLWYVPMDRIKSELARFSEAVCVERGTYLYALNFYISPDEKVALIKAMRSAIYSNGYLVAKNLREIFNKACPSAALDSEYLKDYAIRDILKIIFQDEFDFSSSVITEKGNPLDIGQLYRNYAAEHEQLSLREIKEFQETIGLPIYWDDIFKEMVRISATELVRRDKVQFDVDAVDDALEKMYPNEYTALKDITLFLSLPAASVRWNGYVLESYLRDYSKKFRLVQVSISNDDYYGVMLRSTSDMESYNDVAADMLAKNEGWTDEKSALRCLVDAKFQQRAKNSNISAIVKAARQKRANI